MGKDARAGAAIVLGLVILLASFVLFYPAFNIGTMFAVPSLEFLVPATFGFLIFMAGALELTTGLGPP